MRGCVVVVIASAACGRVGFDDVGGQALCGAFVELPGDAPPNVAATYHVAPSGDDSRSCAQAMDLSTPRQTIMAGFECVQPGDTLLLRGGTYDEYVADFFGPIRGGSSWETATRVAAYPGEVPVIMPTSGSGRVLTLAGPPASWIIFENLVFDATFVDPTLDTAIKITYGSDPQLSSHHIRFLGGEIRNSPINGLTFDGEDCEVVGVDVYNNGTPGDRPGLVLHTGSIVEHSRIHDNADRGLMVYSGSETLRDVRIRFNQIYNNGSTLLIASGENVDVYRNVMWNNGGGVQIDSGSPRDIRVWHNTIVDNDSGAAFCLFVASDATDVDFANNVCAGNSLGILDDGSGTILRANAMTDPGFVDRAAGQFELAPTSSALDGGVMLSPSAYAGSAPDLGAFEAPVAIGARQCDAITVDVATESIAPLAVENCAGFVVQSGSMMVPATDCVVGVGALRLTFAAPITGPATLVHDGTAVRDTARIGGIASSRMHPFSLPIGD